MDQSLKEARALVAKELRSLRAVRRVMKRMRTEFSKSRAVIRVRTPHGIVDSRFLLRIADETFLNAMARVCHARRALFKVQQVEEPEIPVYD